jgi:hypothetical protein
LYHPLLVPSISTAVPFERIPIILPFGAFLKFKAENLFFNLTNPFLDVFDTDVLIAFAVEELRRLPVFI